MVRQLRSRLDSRRFDAGDWIKDLPVQSRSLATTGIWDDKLKEWILAFQRWAAKGYGGDANFKVDGIVDPMPIESIAVSPRFASRRISILAFLCNRGDQSEQPASECSGE